MYTHVVETQVAIKIKKKYKRFAGFLRGAEQNVSLYYLSYVRGLA